MQRKMEYEEHSTHKTGTNLKKSGAGRLPESVDVMHSKRKVWPEDKIPAGGRKKKKKLFAVKELGGFVQEYFHMESSTENLCRTEVLLGEIKVQMKQAVTSCQDGATYGL